METVAGKRFKCWASILSVAGLSASGSLFFSVIALRGNGCATYCNSCTPWASAVPVGALVTKVFPKIDWNENYKIETKEGVD